MKLSFFKELTRRNVYRVAIAYLVTSWLSLQVTDVVGPIVGVPDWFSLALLVTLSIGFVLTLIVSWLYDFTPEGIQLEKDIDRTRPRTSTGRKLDFAIIAMLGLVIVVLVLGNYVIGPGSAHQQSADHQSIAVLPFEIRGSAPDSDELIGGLHEDIIVRLAKLPSFSKVITYHSVSKYAGSELSPSSIGRQLEVAIVVIGSLQASGGRIRLNVQMLDVDEDRHLWAESYERDLNLANAFDLQSSLAQDIVTQLRGAIGETELQDINAIPTNSIEAYKEYVLGRHLFAQRAVAMAQA